MKATYVVGRPQRRPSRGTHRHVFDREGARGMNDHGEIYVTDVLYGLIDDDPPGGFDQLERIGSTLIRVQLPDGTQLAVAVVPLELLFPNLYLRRGRVLEIIRRRAFELVAERDVTVSTASPRKMVLTLGVKAAQVTRRLAAEMGVSYPEVVRWGLMLVEFVRSLGPDEEVVIRNKKDGTLERLSFQWGA